MEHEWTRARFNIGITGERFQVVWAFICNAIKVVIQAHVYLTSFLDPFAKFSHVVKISLKELPGSVYTKMKRVVQSLVA